MVKQTGQEANLQATTKDTKSTKESENETLDAIFQPGVVEVDQSPDPHAGQFHVDSQTKPGTNETARYMYGWVDEGCTREAGERNEGNMPAMSNGLPINTATL
jgi:hypothetical protein